MQNLNHFELKKLVLIGASTGGPGQIQKIINALPKLQHTSIIIAQHMVKGFMQSFAKRLHSNQHNTVQLIQDKEQLKSSVIYLCEGKTTLDININVLRFSFSTADESSYNPDINLLFSSFIPLSKEIEILSVILTGIGDDGVEACSKLSTSGVRCITETKSSAIVDGMPNRARALVKDIEFYDIKDIINIIREFAHDI